MFDCNFQHVVTQLLADLGGKHAGEVQLALTTGDLSALNNIKLDPRDYDDPEVYFRDNQTVELLRKLNLPGDVARLSQAAIDTFHSCEKACKLTNDRMDRLIHHFYEGISNAGLMYEYINTCKKFISKVLGPLPDSLVPCFGKGATYSLRAPLTTVPDKMTERPCATEAAAYICSPMFERTAWARAARNYDASWSAPVDIVRGNRFTSIPKDQSKRRGICIEPDLNISFQLPVGKLLKSRLLRVGIDLRGSGDTGLSTGQMLHRDLARRASRTGEHATIDLSNASDTVSAKLVKLLLPTEWFELLDGLRSRFTNVNGKWYKLEKFSSMGNGFTFELETLIFCALAHGCGANIGRDTFVYGDDIIVPTGIAADLCAALKFFGFEPNPRKTFLTGRFRESCGGDYFDGVPVRAHYLEELPAAPQDWIKLANGLRRVAFSETERVTRWARVRTAHELVLAQIPSKIRRLRGPVILGDVVIHDCSWRTVCIDGVYHVRAYAPVINTLLWHHFRPSVQLAAALYGVPSEGPTPRQNVAGYKVRMIACSRT